MGTRIPSYRRHKARDLAIVTIRGKTHYLGRWGSPESKAAYRQIIIQHLDCVPETIADQVAGDPSVTVEEVLAAYWEHAETIYVDRESGEPTSELDGIRMALRFARRFFGDCRARDFGPLKLKRCRQAMVDKDLARTTVNSYVGKIKRVFRWAAENEVVPASVYHGLQSVPGLRVGKTEARETERVRPVPQQHVTPILSRVSAQVRALIEFQLLTGARPGETVRLRPCDLDYIGPHGCWVYRPARHKTQHTGHERVIFIGPKAQEVLESFLDRNPVKPFFSPADAEEARNAERRATRKTKMWKSHQPSRRRRPKPGRSPNGEYSVDSYRRAIGRACKEAKVPVWTPHQLRHSVGTSVRAEFDAETARVVLGHENLSTTEIYSERDLETAAKAIAEIG